MIKLEITNMARLELRGRQSVRTSFRLTERCIDALSILAAQMGIKQKSLFDQLVDDPQVLKAIARQYDNSLAVSSERVTKTYVVSRSTLDSLENVSSKYNTPRDALVEFSIERIYPLIEQEKKKHSHRREIVREMAKQLQEQIRLFEKAEAELGAEDPIIIEMQSILKNSDISFNRILQFMEKSKRIEQF